MQNFIDDARQIVTDYWNACERPEQLKAEATAKRQANEITEDFERSTRLEQNNIMLRARTVAQGRLEELREKFKQHVAAWSAPNVAAMDSDDYKLLAADFPLTLDEFRALCERNRNNPTVLRKAVEYGKAPVHPWAPYAAAVCAPAEKKTAAFEDVLKAAGAALQSDRQHSSALNDRHWAVLTDRAREIIGATAQREPTEEEQKAASTAAQKAAAAEWYRTHRWNGTTWERRA